MKNGFNSPPVVTLVYFRLMSSPTAHLRDSTVAGLSKTNASLPSPLSILAALTASRSAKNTVDPINNGGSPTPLLLAMDRKCFQLIGFPWLSYFNMLTLNSCGIFPNPGILYAPGPVVAKQPVLEFHSDSSRVKSPWPCTKAPSICP